MLADFLAMAPDPHPSAEFPFAFSPHSPPDDNHPHPHTPTPVPMRAPIPLSSCPPPTLPSATQSRPLRPAHIPVFPKLPSILGEHADHFIPKPFMQRRGRRIRHRVSRHIPMNILSAQSLEQRRIQARPNPATY